MLTTVDGHWELQAAALLEAVWWDFRLADGLVLLRRLLTEIVGTKSANIT